MVRRSEDPMMLKHAVLALLCICILKFGLVESVENSMARSLNNYDPDIEPYEDRQRPARPIFNYRQNGVKIDIRVVPAVNDSSGDADDRFPAFPAQDLGRCLFELSISCARDRIARFIDTIGKLDEITLFGSGIKLVKTRALKRNNGERRMMDVADGGVGKIDRSIDDFFDMFALRISLPKTNGKRERNQIDVMFDDNGVVEGRGKKGGGGGGGKGGGGKCKKMMMMLMMMGKMKLMAMAGVMSMKGLMMAGMSLMISKAMMIMKLMELKKGMGGFGGGGGNNCGGGGGGGGSGCGGGGGGGGGQLKEIVLLTKTGGGGGGGGYSGGGGGGGYSGGGGGGSGGGGGGGHGPSMDAYGVPPPSGSPSGGGYDYPGGGGGGGGWGRSFSNRLSMGRAMYEPVATNAHNSSDFLQNLDLLSLNQPPNVSKVGNSSAPWNDTTIWDSWKSWNMTNSLEGVNQNKSDSGKAYSPKNEETGPLHIQIPFVDERMDKRESKTNRTTYAKKWRNYEAADQILNPGTPIVAVRRSPRGRAPKSIPIGSR